MVRPLGRGKALRLSPTLGTAGTGPNCRRLRRVLGVDFAERFLGVVTVLIPTWILIDAFSFRFDFSGFST